MYKELVIHFRLASGGNMSKEMTYPFTIENKYEERIKLSGETRIGVIFHNGTMIDHGGVHESNSCEFARGFSEYNKSEWIDLCERQSNFRLEILTPDEIIG